jgi:hypothetical protein
MEQKLLDAYYEFKGWDANGIPTRQTLHHLGLDFVGEDLMRRKIIESEKNRGS